MKRFIAIILALTLLLGIQGGSFAIKETKITGERYSIKGRNPAIYDSDYDPFLVNDTDIMDTEDSDTEYEFDEELEVDRDKIISEYVEYNYRDELEYDKKKIIEDAYKILANAIDRKDGALSVYWAESDFLPYTIVFKIREYDRAKGFTYLEFKDDKWQQMEHVFDDKNELVIVNVSVNGPIAICYTPGGSGAIFEGIAEQQTVYDSVTGKTVTIKGTTAGSIPPHIHHDEDVVTIAVDQSYMLTAVNWDVFNKAYSEIKDQVPEGMTARYFFWLQEEVASDVEFALEDIKIGDTVICKLYNGTWKEQHVVVTEDGLVKIHFDNTGAALIMTEINKSGK